MSVTPDPSRRGVLGLGAALTAGSLAACGASPRDPAATVDEEARVDELLSDVADESASVPPIDANEHAERRGKLAALLGRYGVDAYLTEGGATMQYLAGMTWGHSERLFGLVVLADGRHFWVCPAFEEPKARLRIDAPGGPGGELLPWDEHEYPWSPLASELQRLGVDRVAVDPKLRSFATEGLRRTHGAQRLLLGDALVRDLRGIKDPHELALLRKANELTQQAIRVAAERLPEGSTGADLGRLVRRAQERMGLTNTWALSLVGPAAAYPHGGVPDAPIAPGDPILVDTGGALHGYQSDNTRTWAHDGAVSSELRRVWTAVRDAQERAFEALVPGRPCREADLAARESLVRAGFEDGYAQFTHRLGHGIGMEGHEDPYLDGGSYVPLQPGMTFSDEPGIYVIGELGVRIEDIVAVTEDGADHFGTWQVGPESPA